MKYYAILILTVICASVFVEPMIELLNLTQEKVVLGTAVTNACRAAKDRSMIYEKHRDLDAHADEEKFKDYFSEAFEAAVKADCTGRTGDVMTFAPRPGNDRFGTFTVRLEFVNSVDAATEQEKTAVKVNAEAVYRFKTNYLRLAEDAGEDVEYKLKSERMLLLTVKN